MGSWELSIIILKKKKKNYFEKLRLRRQNPSRAGGAPKRYLSYRSGFRIAPSSPWRTAGLTTLSHYRRQDAGGVDLSVCLPAWLTEVQMAGLAGHSTV